jgi:hypothetical protein
MSHPLKDAGKGKTVAIVGFASLTMRYCQQSQADEFWSINHAFKVIGDTLPRLDRMIEIHEEPWIRREELPSSEAYWDWLQEKHDFPIYMQDVHPQIPASEKYPFDEICTDLFGRFLRGEERVEFFGSSFSYLCALAVYMGFSRIEIYGIEMQTGTEYSGQYPSGCFIIGVAVGRGIKVILHPESVLCKANLYGFYTAPYVSKTIIERYLEYYAHRLPALQTITNQYLENYNTIAMNGASAQARTEALAVAQNAHADYANMLGAHKMLENLHLEGGYYNSRQKLEGHKGQVRGSMEHWKAEANYRRATYNAFVETPGHDVEQARKLFQKHVEAWEIMHRYDGAYQIIGKLLEECDQRAVSFDLERRIFEKEPLENG